MKILFSGLLALFAGMVLTTAAQATPVDSTFTYQGELQDGGLPAIGTYDFEFRLFDLASGGVQQGPVLMQTLDLGDGVFTTALDFGASPFSLGERLWLEVRVRSNGGGGFTILDPRQEITGAPFAAHALSLREDAVGTLEIADGSVAAIDVDESQIQWRIWGSCPAGQSIRSVGPFGGVTCEVDDDTNTTYDGTDFSLSDQNCPGDSYVHGVSANGFFF